MKNWILVLALCACQGAPLSTTTTPASAELATRRGQMIAWLQDYYEAGVYPTNAEGRPLSVFEDAHGVRCPMAELIYRSGHADLVDAVVRENNGVRLADVTDGPLHDWMVGSGLTREEIVMVQGAADIDHAWMREQPNAEIFLARGEVRGRLVSAVRALRDGTPHSLEVATAKLPEGRMPVVGAITGPILAARGPRIAPADETTPASPRSSGTRR